MQINFRDGLIWSARPILESKDESWKQEILTLVVKVHYQRWDFRRDNE
jgi:hypothetical protein